DYDACVLQAELCFTDGALAGEQVTLWPVSVSGSDRRNDYQPALLTGKDAQRVIEKMQATSAFTLSPYADGLGAIQPWVDCRQEGQ
ncbi:MAG: hypothetical protein PHY64_11245, partial [Eubacteriales bacterium]|nr:hypothetical protein [Eubacteriales bacterium]